jgi:hypothetical protein
MPVSALVADVDGDGIADLVVINKASNTFSVLRGNGDGSFKSSTDFVAGNEPLATIAGDFYANGHVDLAIVNRSSQSVSLPLGNGDGTFKAARSYSAGQKPISIASGNLNGDKIPALVVANYCGADAICSTAGSVAVFLADDKGVYRLADVNGDKNLDIVALTVGMTVSPSSSTSVDQTVTFTAQLSGAAMTPVAPTGSISFRINGNPSPDCPTLTLDVNFRATCTTGVLATSSDSISATYTGDSNFRTASGSITQTISASNSVTMIQSSQPSSTVNQPVKGSYQVTVVFYETVAGAATSWILLPILLLPLMFLRKKLAARNLWVNACFGLILLAGTAVAFIGCGGSPSAPPPTHQVVSSGVVSLTVQ